MGLERSRSHFPRETNACPPARYAPDSGGALRAPFQQFQGRYAANELTWPLCEKRRSFQLERALPAAFCTSPLRNPHLDCCSVAASSRAKAPFARLNVARRVVQTQAFQAPTHSSRAPPCAAPPWHGSCAPTPYLCPAPPSYLRSLPTQLCPALSCSVPLLPSDASAHPLLLRRTATLSI